MTKLKSQMESSVRMIDVSDKDITQRTAQAQAEVYAKKQTIEAIAKGKVPKGDVLTSAKLAGIMAAKKTPDLIPLCHPLEITEVRIDFKLSRDSIIIKSEATCFGRTGVEMEALTAVCVAALTVYDMCKAIDREIVISEIKLLKKTGGKSGTYVRHN